MDARPLRSRRLAAVLGLGIALVAAACGGAIDNSELFQKEQGTSSGGTTPAPTATGSATSLPPSTPTPQPTQPKGCAVSFKKDVLDVLSAGGCASVQCHGGPTFINQPNIDPAQSALTYKNLMAYEIEGTPYVAMGSTDPDDSSITCNLRGDCGTRMPLGEKLSSKQLAVIEKWLMCGAPFN